MAKGSGGGTGRQRTFTSRLSNALGLTDRRDRRDVARGLAGGGLQVSDRQVARLNRGGGLTTRERGRLLRGLGVEIQQPRARRRR